MAARWWWASHCCTPCRRPGRQVARRQPGRQAHRHHHGIWEPRPKDELGRDASLQAELHLRRPAGHRHIARRPPHQQLLRFFGQRPQHKGAALQDGSVGPQPRLPASARQRRGAGSRGTRVRQAAAVRRQAIEGGQLAGRSQVHLPGRQESRVGDRRACRTPNSALGWAAGVYPPTPPQPTHPHTPSPLVSGATGGPPFTLYASLACPRPPTKHLSSASVVPRRDSNGSGDRSP